MLFLYLCIDIYHSKITASIFTSLYVLDKYVPHCLLRYIRSVFLFYVCHYSAYFPNVKSKPCWPNLHAQYIPLCAVLLWSVVWCWNMKPEIYFVIFYTWLSLHIVTRSFYLTYTLLILPFLSLTKCAPTKSFSFHPINLLPNFPFHIPCLPLITVF